MQCERFTAEGVRCGNDTDHVDGWCRQPGCDGFRRASNAVAPPVTAPPKGTAKHLREWAPVPVALDVDEAADVRVSARAIDSFRFHHGGSAADAEAELRTMLEDFLLKSARRVNRQGFVTLARDGFELVLSPNLTVVSGYTSAHRERTWLQVKAGVRSRFRHRKPRAAAGVRPEPGPPVPAPAALRVLDADTVYLTGRVRSSFARLAQLGSAAEEDLDAALRSELAHLPQAVESVRCRDDQMIEVACPGRVWLFTQDMATVVGVKRVDG